MELPIASISKIDFGISQIMFENIIKFEYTVLVCYDSTDTTIVKQGFHSSTKDYF